MEPPSGSPCGWARLLAVAGPPLPTLPGWHRSLPPAGPAPDEVAAPPQAPALKFLTLKARSLGKKNQPPILQSPVFQNKRRLPLHGPPARVRSSEARTQRRRQEAGRLCSGTSELHPAPAPAPPGDTPPHQSRPRLPPHIYVSSGVLLAESELCLSAALWLLNLTDLKFVHDIQTHVAARKPHRSLSGKAAACRRSSQTEIYNSDLGLIRPL